MINVVELDRLLSECETSLYQGLTCPVPIRPAPNSLDTLIEIRKIRAILAGSSDWLVPREKAKESFKTEIEEIGEQLITKHPDFIRQIYAENFSKDTECTCCRQERTVTPPPTPQSTFVSE